MKFKVMKETVGGEWQGNKRVYVGTERHPDFAIILFNSEFKTKRYSWGIFSPFLQRKRNYNLYPYHSIAYFETFEDAFNWLELEYIVEVKF